MRIAFEMTYSEDLHLSGDKNYSIPTWDECAISVFQLIFCISTASINCFIY